MAGINYYLLEGEVESLFASQLCPLTENKIKELVGKKDISEILSELLENGKLKKHEFAPDLSIYWPANWYQSDQVNSQFTTSSPATQTKDSDAVFKTPSKPPEKNHLANTSDSLKARLASRKKRASNVIKTPTNKTSPSPNKEDFSSANTTYSTPYKSKQDNAETNPDKNSSNSTPHKNKRDTEETEERNSDGNSPNSTIKGKETEKSASWITTPSPKRRKVIPPPSKSPMTKGKDIEILEKEKKRLQDLVIQKEALVAKKSKSTKPAPASTPKKSEKDKERDDKQLEILIKKWRAGCQQMLADLQQTTRRPDGTGGLTLGQMIDTFQFERSLFPNLAEDGESFE